MNLLFALYLRLLLACCAIGTALLVGNPAGAAEAELGFKEAGLGFLQKHCIKCHQGDKPKGELALDSFGDEASVIRGRKAWATILSRVQTGDMPPEDQPRPSEQEVTQFVTAVNQAFERADKNAKPDPGRVTMRRLNRTEYRNTIHDLIGVEFDPTEDFPSDDVGHGFDNIGDVLSLSPVLMERYLAASEMIMSQAILPKPPRPTQRTQAARFTEPASGDVPAKGSYRFLSTLPSENPVETGPVYTGYQLENDGDYTFHIKLYAYREQTLEAVGEKKAKPDAADDLLADIEKDAGTNKKTPVAEKPIMAAILLSGPNLEKPASDQEISQISGKAVGNLKPFKILQLVEVKARDAKSAQRIELKLKFQPGLQRFAVALLKEPAGTPAATLFVDTFTLEGPLDMRPASQRRLLALEEGKPKEQQIRRILTGFARRAYRRPPQTEEVDRLVELAEGVMADGGNWEAGMQFAMQAVLCSPKFLFRVELDEAPGSPEIRPLGEFQLASRLSYFLWSSLPDEELLNLAEQGKLSSQLPAQVARMLKDNRSQAMLENFSLQWLQLRRLDTFAPDAKQFPEFDEPLRRAMLKETELFFATVVREDRSILDLLNADFTFLNGRLAKHYGIVDTAGTLEDQEKPNQGGKPIKGNEFVRVSLAGNQRGGILTQASVLTVTSNPTRTSPVKRGRWVLEQILGTPPPPPPANVPELQETEQAALTGSLRQRMEQHRTNPACASCHSRMDPLGFAFENYDAIGAFRTKDGDFKIDPSGELPGGQAIEGPGDLKVVLQEQKDLFARCLTEKMLTYAIGRGIEYYDRPTVDRIVKSLSAEDYKFSALITEIVRSDAFVKRRGIETAAQQ